MITKELKIIPPEGFEIDKENSTFECVKFKPIVKRWRDSNPIVTGYYIIHYPNTNGNYLGINDVFATEKQAKSALAMAQISQIMANDERFGGPVTDEEWKSMNIKKAVIERLGNEIRIDLYYSRYTILAFHTQEQCDLFLEENEDLVKDYLMID